MKKAYLILLLLVIAGTFCAGAWYGQRAVKAGPEPVRKVLYYVDPMNPAHTSDKPGIAPCGMPMEPVYEDGEGGQAKEGPPGTVKIGQEMQQLIGVRVSSVEKAPYTRMLRVPGWVVPDEERLYKVNAAVDGWIEDVAPVTTGDRVEKGQLLGAYGSADLFQFSQQMLFSLQSLRHLAPGQEPTMAVDPVNSNFQQRTQNMRSLGMSPAQIEEFKEKMIIPSSIKIIAPASGFVLTRNISRGERFEKGREWFRIAELSQVWVIADLPENEARYLKPGQVVKVTTPRQGRSFEARVGRILPEFDSVARTLKVRLHVENPEYVLKPNMYVDVEFPVTARPSISVPMSAVLDTGTKKTIYVDRGDGYFEPREVQSGWKFGDRIEITEGLAEGERIVVSGNFLIDSESHMKLAAAGFYGEVRKDPVCGMSVDSDKSAAAGLKKEYGGRSYYFCSEQCRTEFDKQPDRFAAKPANGADDHGPRDVEDHEGHRGEPVSAIVEVVHNPGPAAGDAGEDHTAHQHEHPSARTMAHDPSPDSEDAVKGNTKDPVCGMTVSMEKSKTEGLTGEYQGKTYYFCSMECKQKFEANPGNYIQADGASKSMKDMPGHAEHRP